MEFFTSKCLLSGYAFYGYLNIARDDGVETWHLAFGTHKNYYNDETNLYENEYNHKIWKI